MQAQKQTSSLTLRPIYITHLKPLLLWKNKKTNDTSPNLKHSKYHFTPLTITPTTTYVPPSSINLHILIHMPPRTVDIMFSWELVIGSNTVHSSRTLHTIMYKSYNINTVQITIKNDHHNPTPIKYPSTVVFTVIMAYHTTLTYYFFQIISLFSP